LSCLLVGSRCNVQNLLTYSGRVFSYFGKKVQAAKWRYAGTFIATLMNVRLGIVSAVRSQGLELSRREIPYWHRIVENGESFACRWVEARTLSALLQIIRRLWLLRKRM
jgi:hypothetical protein